MAFGGVVALEGVAGLATVLGDCFAGTFFEAADGADGFFGVGFAACVAGDLAGTGGVSVFLAVLGACSAGDLVPAGGIAARVAGLDGEGTALPLDGS